MAIIIVPYHQRCDQYSCMNISLTWEWWQHDCEGPSAAPACWRKEMPQGLDHVGVPACLGHCWQYSYSYRCTLKCIFLICQRHLSPAWGRICVSQDVAYATFTTFMQDLVIFRWAAFLTLNKTDRLLWDCILMQGSVTVVNLDTVISTSTNNHEVTNSDLDPQLW